MLQTSTNAKYVEACLGIEHPGQVEWPWASLVESQGTHLLPSSLPSQGPLITELPCSEVEFLLLFLWLQMLWGSQLGVNNFFEAV